LGDTRWLVYVAVLILLLKNPTIVYLTFYRAYRVMYAVAIIAIALDYCAVVARGGTIRLGAICGIKAYGVFLYLSLAVLLVDGFLSQRMDIEKTIQFVMNISQFFFILYAVVRCGKPMRILDGAYRVAVVLAVLSLFIAFGNYVGTFPFPGIKVHLQETDAGAMYYYFPFGFTHERLPMPVVSYRAYSYFTEPAYFAVFLIPFLFYAAFRVRTTGRIRHAVCLAVLAVAALFTFSVAGAIALWLAIVSVCVFGFAARPARRPFYCAALCILLGLSIGLYAVWGGSSGTSGDPRFQRAALAIEDRQIQWSVATVYTASHLFGRGIGYSTPQRVFWRTVNRRDLYAEYTNILESVYYLGLVYLAPLSILLLGIAKHVFGGLRSPSPYTRALAAMVWVLLVSNGSAQVLFTGYVSLLLAVFLVVLTQERAAGMAQSTRNIGARDRVQPMPRRLAS
jgi:hypothetical protein